MEYMHESLGSNVIPSRYELLFEPDLESFDFKGKETIQVTIKKKCRSITLNSAGLDISEASIKCNGHSYPAKKSANATNETVTLNVQKAVSGSAQINLTFTGKSTDSLNGLYRSKYAENGKEKWILTTQFEAANARNAFPCFDEPEFKAVYDVSILVDNNLQCISNMPVKTELKRDQKKLVVFGTTPKMSSYLLYLGVGNYDTISDRLGKLKINVITTPGKKKLASLALGYAKRCIKFFEGYFGVPYPLPKIDFIAIPDFAAGAMENWGAITFRETALLADSNASISTKQRIAEVIAHELTHQWFGDLVTMKWWDDLWLNESFATFMSYKAMDAVFPEWNMGVAYLSDVVNVAFSADQLLSTHPIHVRVSKPSEIDQIFDEISYQKGGSVLNMLEDYVGKDAFRKGLNIYLREKSYSNAEADDLWTALSKAVGGKGPGADVKALANSWITKTGYPNVTVKKVGNKTVLSQKRFTLLESVSKKEIWPIPIHYSTSPKDKAGKKLFMSSESMVLNVKEPIKLNLNQKGFFRTRYPEEILDELGNMIKENELNGADAWGIENDLYAFTKSCRYPLSIYLNFVNSYCFAAKYPLNMGVLMHLNGLYNILYTSKSVLREEVRKTLRDYSVEVLKQVGWIRSSSEGSVTTKMRSYAIACSAFAGDAATIHKSNKLFKMFIDGNRSIDSNLRTAVYNTVAFNGGSEIFKTFLEKYLAEEIPDEKHRFLQALGRFNDPDLARRALSFSLSKEVRFDKSMVIPSMVSSLPIGEKLIWPWTKENWKILTSRYPSGTHLLSYFVDNLATISDPKTLNEINSFYAKRQNMRGDITTALKQANEIAKINMRFMKENGV